MNVSAVSAIYSCIIKAVSKVNDDLSQLVFTGKDMTFSTVRQFVVDFYVIELADYIIYSAMKAPTDDLFFQRRQSDDWKLIDANTTCYEISNEAKYQWQLRFMLNSLVAAGASLLNAMAKEGAAARGYT